MNRSVKYKDMPKDRKERERAQARERMRIRRALLKANGGNMPTKTKKKTVKEPKAKPAAKKKVAAPKKAAPKKAAPKKAVKKGKKVLNRNPVLTKPAKPGKYARYSEDREIVILDFEYTPDTPIAKARKKILDYCLKSTDGKFVDQVAKALLDFYKDSGSTTPEVAPEKTEKEETIETPKAETKPKKQKAAKKQKVTKKLKPVPEPELDDDELVPVTDDDDELEEIDDDELEEIDDDEEGAIDPVDVGHEDEDEDTPEDDFFDEDNDPSTNSFDDDDDESLDDDDF